MSIIEAIVDMIRLFGGLATRAATMSRRAHMRRYAAARRLPWRKTDRTLVTNSPFVLFQSRPGAAANVITAPGGDAVLFDFNCSTPLGTRRGSASNAPAVFTCVLLPVDVYGPPLRIGPRGLESGEGIPFESDAFNRAFLVRSSNRMFATAVVDARMMEWLLSTDRSWTFELCGRRLLCYAPRVATDRLDTMTTVAAAFRERIPRVVASLYPSTRPA